MNIRIKYTITDPSEVSAYPEYESKNASFMTTYKHCSKNRKNKRDSFDHGIAS